MRIRLAEICTQLLPRAPNGGAKMKHLTVLLFFCLGTLTVGYGQNPVGGATVEFISFDSAREMGTFRITNTSNKDITAYAVAEIVTFQNGKPQWSGETMKDFGAPPLFDGLHPGAIEEVAVKVKSPNVKAEAKVVAVVYADLICEWSDSEALSRIEDHRKSMVVMDGVRVEAIKAALAESASDHPGAKAASIIRQRIPTDRASVEALARKEKLSPFAYSSSSGVSAGYMEDDAKKLEHEPKEAIRAGRSERDYLGDQLEYAKKQYEAEREYVQIRRQP